jgi:hypothetical protein
LLRGSIIEAGGRKAEIAKDAQLLAIDKTAHNLEFGL